MDQEYFNGLQEVGGWKWLEITRHGILWGRTMSSGGLLQTKDEVVEQLKNLLGLCTKNKMSLYETGYVDSKINLCAICSTGFVCCRSRLSDNQVNFKCYRCCIDGGLNCYWELVSLVSRRFTSWGPINMYSAWNANLAKKGRIAHGTLAYDIFIHKLAHGHTVYGPYIRQTLIRALNQPLRWLSNKSDLDCRDSIKIAMFYELFKKMRGAREPPLWKNMIINETVFT